MKLISKVRDLPYALAAMATVAMTSSEAKADANNVGGMADTITTQLGSVGKAAVAGMFLGGIVFVGSGLLRLKKAADTQGQQVSYSEGFWRIGVGAALMAIPFLSGVASQSLGLGDTGVAITRGGGTSF